MTNHNTELLDALKLLADLGEDDDGIRQEVYATALTVISAVTLKYPNYNYRLFNHGPNSVVLLWEIKDKNYYLTIGDGLVSELVSTKDSIELSEVKQATQFIAELMSKDDKPVEWWEVAKEGK